MPQKPATVTEKSDRTRHGDSPAFAVRKSYLQEYAETKAKGGLKLEACFFFCGARYFQSFGMKFGSTGEMVITNACCDELLTVAIAPHQAGSGEGWFRAIDWRFPYGPCAWR